ncbi:hypothetical protein MA3A0930S_4534 [Mycobacteroides abscessus 3A-0930-S]|nr:hypothetical protein MA6G1108_4416 [Mycobacteroides abscessus 6G-1108]EIV23788.1 hypothetical protein MA3A0122R_4685 [Mycobacteroides abscessus 3A-0122-R]EIV34944.1 hypothetical protein MA3A0731_4678 [Mycobacteroides abscessus 3A-0731]EIV44745.1 hypothetical protein MA3A0930R_4598 [Mycobacteroides abscessus 3A-0930-R]EIV45642.1 hypothetical protein MA3A0930S_4534 [Mycobacteroides abscessus 3A-0930-S]EIV60359.1 hypothetical protein MA4S0116S_3260 [Mycobacteroides abscessus 4S-0116-S]EIV7003
MLGDGIQVENRKIPSEISSTVVCMDSVCARACRVDRKVVE